MADYLIGSAVEDATPAAADVDAGRVQLAGYVARTGPAERVAAALSTRALVVDDDEGGLLALVTLDVCAIEHTFTEGVRARVRAATGIPDQHLLITVTHTHSAPVTRPFPVFGDAAAVPDPDYLERLADGTVTAVERAFTERQPARLFLGRGATGIGFNRHRVDGPYDDVLDVLQAVAEDTGDTIAIAFFHGCHPVTEPDLSVVSPDFPGPARDAVEEVFGGDALFVQGFAGTANPRAGIDVGAVLAADVGAALADDLVRLRGPILVVTTPVDLTMRPPPERHVVQALRDQLVGDLDLQRAAARRWCDRVLAGDAPETVETALVTVRVGAGSSAWRLCAVSHEVVGEWAPAVRSLWSDPLVTLAGYTGGVDCYLPTAAILDEAPDEDFPLSANYEGCTSFMYYGLPTRFSGAIDEELLGAVDRLDGHRRQGATWAVGDADGAAVLLRTATGAAAVAVPALSAPAEWTPLPGPIDGVPVVVRAVNGALAAFVRGADGTVLHTWQAGPDRTWVPWTSLGGAVDGDVSALVALDGRLAVLGRAPGGGLALAAQVAPLAGWAGWTELPADLAGSPAAIVVAGGEVVVAARSAGGDLVALALPPGLLGAGEWETVAPDAGGDPALAPGDDDGAVVVAVVGAGGSLVVAAREPGGPWAAPVDAGGTLTGRPALAVTGTTGGRTTAVARGSDGALRVAHRSGTGRWGSWAALGGEPDGDPALVPVASGALWVLAPAGDGTLLAASVPTRVQGQRRFVRLEPRARS